VPINDVLREFKAITWLTKEYVSNRTSFGDVLQLRLVEEGANQRRSFL